jgi:hypothetical protein
LPLHSESAQHCAAPTHDPPQQRCPAVHVESLVHGQVPHCWVVASQHCPAVQSPLAWQHGVHAPPVQHFPAPQSASPQHAAVAQRPSTQHMPAWQSAVVWHSQVMHACPRQHWPARQSPSLQHWPGTQRAAVGAARGVQAATLSTAISTPRVTRPASSRAGMIENVRTEIRSS